MKNKIFISCLLLFFVFGCVSAPPAKQKRSVKQQHDRSQMAFDELEGKQTGSRTAAPHRAEPEATYSKPKPTPEPVYSEPETMNLSSSRYLSAKGYGASKPGAIRQAKAELSNIFEARISSDVTSKTKQVTDSIKGSSFNKSIQSKIRVQSDIELEGVITGPVKRESGEYVAVVAIDKQKAKEKWGRDIKKLNTKIDVLLKKSNAAQSKILKLMPLKKVLGLWVEKEVALSRLRVLGYSADFPQKDLKPILLTISQLKSGMLIDLDVSGTHGDTVRDNVAEILTDNGFKIGDFESDADLLITGSVKIKQVKNNNPRFKFSRAIISLNIIDTRNNNQVGQVSENARGAGLNYDEAAHNAVKKVYKKVSQKLVQYFN